MKLDDSAIDLGDGAYELLAISMPRDIFQTTNIITALLTQKYETCNLIHFSKITHCEIYYPRPGDWSLDGERGKGKEKNVFDIIPDAVFLEEAQNIISRAFIHSERANKQIHYFA